MKIHAVLPALVLLLAVGTAPGAGEERLLLVRAGRGILGNGPEIVPASVLVRGDRIEAVGKNLPAPEGAIVVDAPDAVLTPGLVDAHAWLDLQSSLGESSRASTPLLRAADALDASSDGLAAERASGVTSLLLAPSDRNVIGGRPALVLADEGATLLRETLGMKLALGVPALATARFPSTHWGALELIRREASIHAGFDAVPAFIRASGTVDLKAVLALLRERPELRVSVVGGERAFELADELGKRDVAVIWGPAGLDAPPKVLEGPKVLDEAGVRLAFGTGGRPGSLRRTAILAHRAGLPREATIRALTSGAAEILGEGERLGLLAEGCRADLVLFSGDPLDLCSRTLRVFVGGVQVYPDGETRR